jgi:pyruvate formate lyase activating enzyme
LKTHTNAKTLISNIQRYAIHDGGGIRTTVFFKGCPLACAWCHNPETISFKPEGEYFSYTPQELIKIIMRDQIFFGDSGGVTLSGGEPLAQSMAYILEFAKLLKQNGVNIACDTCGDVPWENFAAILTYVNLFLYDIKLASEDLHIKYTGRSNQRIIENLKKLSPLARVRLRIPVIGGVNDGEEMANIINLAKSAAPGSEVSLLPYHNLGKDKWDKTDIQPTEFNFHTPSKEHMAKIAKDWEQAGFKVEIGG